MPRSSQRSLESRVMKAPVKLVLATALLLVLGACASLPPSPAKTVAFTVNVRAYGARGNGKHDDTAAFQRAMNAVAEHGGGVVHVARGTYRVTNLTIRDRVSIAGEGAARTWLRGRVTAGSKMTIRRVRIGARHLAFHLTRGATDSLFDHVTFVGGGPMSSDDDQGVIRLAGGRGASFITFRSCTIGANSADGNGVSIVDSGWSGATYHDISWQDCHFLGSPRMTFECIEYLDGRHTQTTGYYNIDLRDCLFEPSGSQTISYGGKGSFSGRSTISGCTIKGAGWNSAYPWGQGVEFNGVVGMQFTGNTVDRCRGSMINHQGYAGTTTANVFSGNTFDGTTSHISAAPTATTTCITYINVTGSRFDDNLVKSNAGGQLVYLSGSSGNTFSGDTLVDPRAQADAHQCIWVAKRSLNNTFSSVRFVSPVPHGTAVFVDGADHNTIQNSTFVTSGSAPVRADPGLTVRLIGNTVQ